MTLVLLLVVLVLQVVIILGLRHGQSNVRAAMSALDERFRVLLHQEARAVMVRRSSGVDMRTGGGRARLRECLAERGKAVSAETAGGGTVGEAHGADGPPKGD